MYDAPNAGMQPSVVNEWCHGKNENSISGINDTPRDMRAPCETKFGNEGTYEFATLPFGVDPHQCPPVSVIHEMCRNYRYFLIANKWCVYAVN